MADEATTLELTMPRMRSELLGLLRAQPFNYGGKDDLAEVKTFMEDNDIKIADETGELDIDAVWKKTILAPVVKFSRTEDDRAADIVSKAGKLNRQTSANVSQKAPMTAEQYDRIAARKSYDRRAARKQTEFDCSDISELAGAFMRYAAFGTRDYSEKSFDRDIITKASDTYINVQGGSLVAPPELSRNLIELREKYGVAPALVGVTDMPNDKYLFARNDADCTVYWNGENVAATESDLSLDSVQLNANKLLGMNRHPFEMMNDSAIGIGDIVARAFARESARKIDDAYFNGTGTATYGTFRGIGPLFQSLSVTRANIAGYVVASGNLFSEFTMSDVINLVTKLPVYAQEGAALVCHSVAFGQAIERCLRAAGSSTFTGGVTYDTQAGQKPRMQVLGYPVYYSQVMTNSDANDQCVAYFGNFALGSKIGRVRNSLAFEMSPDRYFEYDQIAFRFRERVAINVHDIGNASATAASRVVGPIVTLASAAA